MASVDRDLVLRSLRARMNEAADLLDSGVLAPREIQEMPSDEVGLAFRAIVTGWRQALEHWPEDDRCPVDEEVVPCRAVRDVLVLNDVAPPYDATERPAHLVLSIDGNALDAQDIVDRIRRLAASQRDA